MVSKKYIKQAFFILAVTMAVVTVGGSYLKFKTQEKLQDETVLNYQIFKTNNPAFDFTFEYPKTGWTPVETAGRVEKYDLVFLSGPVSEEKKFRNIIHITVRPLTAGETAPQLLENYLKLNSNFRNFRILRKKPAKIAGKEAASGVYEYAVSLPQTEQKSDLVTIREVMIFFTKEDKSYGITFSAIAEQYEVYGHILDHVLKTFKFVN